MVVEVLMEVVEGGCLYLLVSLIKHSTRLGSTGRDCTEIL